MGSLLTTIATTWVYTQSSEPVEISGAESQYQDAEVGSWTKSIASSICDGDWSENSIGQDTARHLYWVQSRSFVDMILGTGTIRTCKMLCFTIPMPSFKAQSCVSYARFPVLPSPLLCLMKLEEMWWHSFAHTG